MSDSAPSPAPNDVDAIAGFDFVPWTHHDGEWRPPSNEEWTRLANPHLISTSFAWLTPHKSKLELIAIADRAATIAAVERRADDREAGLLAQLGERDRVLRQTLASVDTLDSLREKLRSELAMVTAERRKLIDQIASRDSQFAAEITEYRRQIASIASSPDPRKRAALARYASGDRKGAMEVLIDVKSAETAALSAGWRDVAKRAVEQYRRNELAREDAIAILDRAARIVGTDRSIWLALRELLMEAGRPDEARSAASHAGLR